MIVSTRRKKGMALPLAVLATALGLVLIGCSSSVEINGSTPGTGLGWLPGPGTTRTRELVRSLDATGARFLVVKATNGNVAVRGGTSDRVSLEALVTVRAPSEDEARAMANRVSVRMELQGEAVLVEPVYPALPSGYQVNVALNLTCPHRLALDLTVTNGSVETRDVDGAMRVSTQNGDIRTDIGRMDAAGTYSTTNGSIQVTVDSGQASLTARTTNGTIQVALPATFGGRFDGATGIGEVRSEFDLQDESGDRSHLRGTLGEGGDAVVLLRAVNGNVRLSKR